MYNLHYHSFNQQKNLEQVAYLVLVVLREEEVDHEGPVLGLALSLHLLLLDLNNSYGSGAFTSYKLRVEAPIGNNTVMSGVQRSLKEGQKDCAKFNSGFALYRQTVL